MNTEHNDGPAEDWGAVADPILATPPWRPAALRPSRVIAEAAADPHEHDWAGPGFTRPGPESTSAIGPGTRSGRPRWADEQLDWPNRDHLPREPRTCGHSALLRQEARDVMVRSRQ